MDLWRRKGELESDVIDDVENICDELAAMTTKHGIAGFQVFCYTMNTILKSLI